MIYIGLPGRNSHPVFHLPPPKGSTCLPAGAEKLYANLLTALANAVQQNDSAEDHSKGYALSHNPELGKNQLATHDYAVGHVSLLQTALTQCRTAENREAAAQILGYANPSKTQILALVRASRDSDDIVRNNAIRALWLIASSGNKARRFIPARAFVPMLNSEKWGDRNKSGLLLAAMAGTRDPKLLSQLRNETFDSLIEMAKWHDPSHAEPYRELLGKIAGLGDDRIRELVTHGQLDELISEAKGTAPKSAQSCSRREQQ